MTSQEVRFPCPSEPGGPHDLVIAATLYLPSHAPPREGLPGIRLPGLVVGHGAGSRRSRHAEFCRFSCDAGFIVLGLDFRGHGDSAGSTDGPLDLDLCAAADFLRAVPGVDPGRICYRGSSMGGFYGLKAASKACFAAMALLCPATVTTLLRAVHNHQNITAPQETTAEGRADASTRWDIPRLRSYLQSEQTSQPAHLVTCPVLLVHARNDEVVPFADTLLLAENLHVDTTLLALADGTHTSAQHRPDIHDFTVAWLKRQITSCNARI